MQYIYLIILILISILMLIFTPILFILSLSFGLLIYIGVKIDEKYKIFKDYNEIKKNVEIENLKLFNKIKKILGWFFRVIIIIGFYSALIVYLGPKDISNIAISNLTLKDIGINILCVIIGISGLLVLFKVDSKDEDINYIEWFDVGIGVSIIGIIVYFYLIK